MSRTSRPLISATPEQVWAVLDDGWLYAALRGRCRPDARGRRARGPPSAARLHHSVGSWPLMIDDTTSVLEVEENRRILLLARGWPAGQAHVEIVLEPQRAPTPS